MLLALIKQQRMFSGINNISKPFKHTQLRPLVGGEINIPFQHKNRLYRGQGLGCRFSSARLRMANDIVTSQPCCLFVQLVS